MGADIEICWVRVDEFSGSCSTCESIFSSKNLNKDFYFTIIATLNKGTQNIV